MRCPRDRQDGTALIELALFVVPAFMVLLAYAVFYGGVLYNYEVAQKAANNAARYLAGAPALNMGDPGHAGSEVAVAQAIAQADLQTLRPGPNRGPFVTITCDGGSCLGINLPVTISVQVQIINHPDLLRGFALEMTDVRLQAISTMRYVGN